MDGIEPCCDAAERRRAPLISPGTAPMDGMSFRSFTTPAGAVVMVRGGPIVFLAGQAWDHPEISYRIDADAATEGLPLAVVGRAIQNWNDALAASPAPRLRDFQLVRAADGRDADVEIRLRGGADTVHGSTEIVSGREGAIVRAVVRLSWPETERPADLGVLGTLALRGIGRALGLGSAADPADPMYPAFNGVKLQPSAADVVAFAAVEEWYLASSPFFYPPRGYTFA
jgi:hypothetical protein